MDQSQRLGDWLRIVSGCLFVASLFFAAFYSGNDLRPHMGGQLLLVGGFGLLAGYTAWLANPLFLVALALFKRKPGLARLFAGAALAFALGFLAHTQILVDEGGGQAKIMAYGWGYQLWLQALATLLLATCLVEHRIAAGVTAVLQVVIAGLFVHHDGVGTNSISAIAAARESQFYAFCQLSGDKFYARPSVPVRGISYDQAYADGFGHIIDGRFGSQSAALIGHTGLPVEFVERVNLKDKAMPQPYVRLRRGGVKDEYDDKLLSNFHVKTELLSAALPYRLGITAKRIVVYQEGIAAPLAETTFAVSQNDRRFCGSAHAGNFSEDGFVALALGLIHD